MALGGGVWTTQNKALPGAYINIVNASNAGVTIGERGVVAIPYALGKEAGKVIEITKTQFLSDAEAILGIKYDSAEAKPLREIFAHAVKCIIYDMGNEAAKTATEAVSALEPYTFNILAVYTSQQADITTYITAVKNWRDNGKKCQAVVYNVEKPDSEAIINVTSTISDEGAVGHELVAWVAGAEAGCAINSSCTNMIYDGEYTVVCACTQADLATCLENGKFVFHLVYGDVRVLEDVNSLITIDDDKGEDFKYNQTIRVVDQIANDIAKLFNTKYLGKIPNNASGRVSLWGDIIAHHRQLETIQAIENFNASLVTVQQGDSKRSVVINDVVNVVNSMAQIYMTVVVQ